MQGFQDDLTQWTAKMWRYSRGETERIRPEAHPYQLPHPPQPPLKTPAPQPPPGETAPPLQELVVQAPPPCNPRPYFVGCSAPTKIQCITARSYLPPRYNIVYLNGCRPVRHPISLDQYYIAPAQPHGKYNFSIEWVEDTLNWWSIGLVSSNACGSFVLLYIPKSWTVNFTQQAHFHSQVPLFLASRYYTSFFLM